MDIYQLSIYNCWWKDLTEVNFMQLNEKNKWTLDLITNENFDFYIWIKVIKTVSIFTWKCLDKQADAERFIIIKMEENLEVPNNTNENITAERNSDSDLKYGYPCCKARWAQFLNKASWYTFFIFWANFIQSLVTNGLVGVVLSTLEKRFSLTSMQSSWIASVYDVASVPFIIVTSYVGAKCHRPFWTAIGQFTVMLGSVLFVLPQFTTDQVPLNERNSTDDGLCLLNSNVTRPETGETGDSSLQLYLAVFITARILHGFGMTPLYTIAVTYLDDISTKEGFSLYVGE